MGPWKSAATNLARVDLGTLGGFLLGAVGAGVTAVVASPAAQEVVGSAVTGMVAGHPWGWAAAAFLGGVATFMGGARAAQPKQEP